MAVIQLLRRNGSVGEPAISANTYPAISVDDRRAIVVAALRQLGRRRFWALVDVEHRTPSELHMLTTTGTILEPVVAALNAAGVITAPSVGAVMESLRLNKTQIDHGLCHCVNGPQMTAARAADNFAAFA